MRVLLGPGVSEQLRQQEGLATLHVHLPAVANPSCPGTPACRQRRQAQGQATFMVLQHTTGLEQQQLQVQGEGQAAHWQQQQQQQCRWEAPGVLATPTSPPSQNNSRQQ